MTGLVGLITLSVQGMEESLVYYRTPTEVVRDPPSRAERVRVGGLVVQDSVNRTGPLVRLRVTDGVTDLAVLHRGDLPAIFREGEGAVLEGQLDSLGRLHSDRLMVKHSNEYAPPDADPSTGIGAQQ